MDNQYQAIHDICDILQDFTLIPENRLTKLKMYIVKTHFSDKSSSPNYIHMVNIKELIYRFESIEYSNTILNKISEYLLGLCK